MDPTDDDIEGSLFDTAGESGDDTGMSAYGEYDAIRLPVDDLNGASSAMAQSTQATARIYRCQWQWRRDGLQ